MAVVFFFWGGGGGGGGGGGRGDSERNEDLDLAIKSVALTVRHNIHKFLPLVMVINFV